MTDEGTAGTPRREVSWGGKLLGLGIMGVAVIVVIAGENSHSRAIMANALPILGGALLAAILVPLALFRRVVRD